MKVMEAIESIGITGIKLVTELLTCDEFGSRRVSESINHGEKYNAIIPASIKLFIQFLSLNYSLSVTFIYFAIIDFKFYLICNPNKF